VILRINFGGVPTVTFTVPAAQLGNGTAVVGIPTLEFEMSIQSQNLGPDLTATMTYTAPATLVSGGNSIPIATISWTSVAIAGAPGGTTLIPGGTFAAGSHAILSITSTGGNTYAGGALTFQFANAAVYPQGTYGPATVNYTASRNP
jgi:hypothetical protein